jgi:hypothetical protein
MIASGIALCGSDFSCGVAIKGRAQWSFVECDSFRLHAATTVHFRGALTQFCYTSLGHGADIACAATSAATSTAATASCYYCLTANALLQLLLLLL